MKIELAKKEDIKNIASLAVQVWLDTYATEGIRDVFSEYVWNELTPESFQKRFDDKNRLFISVKKNNHLIGFVEINTNSTSPVNSELNFEIDKLYIQNNFCGKNIGSEIISFIGNYCSENSIPGMWLTVYENNIRAIKFYFKNDFEEIGEYYFHLENESHRNLVMYKKVNDT